MNINSLNGLLGKSDVRIVHHFRIPKDEGLGVFEYVSGWCSKTHSSHAWLEKGCIIIDATIDQFADESNPVMLLTSDRTFHSQFSDREERRADGDFRIVGGACHLHSAYACLKQFID